MKRKKEVEVLSNKIRGLLIVLLLFFSVSTLLYIYYANTSFELNNQQFKYSEGMEYKLINDEVGQTSWYEAFDTSGNKLYVQEFDEGDFIKSVVEYKDNSYVKTRVNEMRVYIYNDVHYFETLEITPEMDAETRDILINFDLLNTIRPLRSSYEFLSKNKIVKFILLIVFTFLMTLISLFNPQNLLNIENRKRRIWKMKELTLTKSRMKNRIIERLIVYIIYLCIIGYIAT